MKAIKQFGFVSFFIQLSQSKYEDVVAVQILPQSLKLEEKPDSIKYEGGSAEFFVPLTDPLLSESILLFLYGTSIATAVFFGEWVVTVFTRVVRCVRSNSEIVVVWGHEADPSSTIFRMVAF